MSKQVTIHEITDGNRASKGWAVLLNNSEKLGEFDSLEAACTFAKAEEEKRAPATDHVDLMRVYAILSSGDFLAVAEKFDDCSDIELADEVIECWRDHFTHPDVHAPGRDGVIALVAKYRATQLIRMQAAHTLLVGLCKQARSGEYEHADDKQYLRNCDLDYRGRLGVLMDRAIVRKYVGDALAAGHTVDLFDGECYAIRYSTDLAAIMAEVGACDEETLSVRTVKDANGKTGLVSAAFLVHGNDGWDVMADNLDKPSCEAMRAGADALSNDLGELVGRLDHDSIYAEHA